MNYELALELKVAGFPQGPSTKGMMGDFLMGTIESDETGIITSNSVYAPELSELIAACGGHFAGLSHPLDTWYARKKGYGVRAMGATPEEAVARLWLALNNKP